MLLIYTILKKITSAVISIYLANLGKNINCSKSTIETLEQGVKYFQGRHQKETRTMPVRSFYVFIVNFKHISYLFLVFLMFTLNK